MSLAGADLIEPPLARPPCSVGKATPAIMATRICPQCGTETQAPFCRADGFATVDSARYLARDLHSREGDLIAGRYRLDQVLGRSPLGSTYRATDLRMQTPVAVRLLAPGLATDLGLIARFQREGRLVASLAHPNIVHVMEHGVAEDGTLFIAQEHVAGPTLAEALQRQGPFDPTRVVGLGRELFDALSEAHTHGVLHRSLALDNIVLMTRPGGGESLKIGDFGLVHVLADDAANPFVFPQVLSHAWRAMAPEQARGRGVSGHADLYAAGCLLYELLCGKPVFGDGSPTDLLVAHSVKMPPPPERDGRVLAGPLVELVMRCLEKKPWNRPDGAQKALDLLELCRLQPILPLPSPTAEFAAPPAGTGPSTRTKPRTNPYGYPSPTSSNTRPNLKSVEPTSMPTDPKGMPRPKPQRLRAPTSPHIEPAPAARAPAEPAVTVTVTQKELRTTAPIPGASAARAESTDRGFASRADLHRSGRLPSEPDLAPKSRSPVLWFLLGMVAAGIAAFVVVTLLGDRSASGPREGLAGQPSVEATNRPPAPEPPHARPAPTPAPLDRASIDEPAPHLALAPDAGSEVASAPDTTVAAAEVIAPDSGPAASDTTMAATAASDATAAPAPEVKLTASDVIANDTNAAALTPKDPKKDPKDPLANKDPKAPPKRVDPLADLEDPEFARPKTPAPDPGIAPTPTPTPVAPDAPDVAMTKTLVESEPRGAQVMLGRRVVGETPMFVEWTGDGVDVVVSKVGYRPQRQRLGPSSGRAVRFVLVPAD